MEGQLKRSSLGRVAFIGELYDARTESFSSRNLLKSSIPSGLIECRDVQKMELDYRFTENVSERFELMDVEGELQLSVLLGLVKAEGSGNFLTEEAKSDKAVTCSLFCKISTICEKFFASFSEIAEHVDPTALEDPEPTHVVTEVHWGANCILSLAAACREESSKEAVRGKLTTELLLLKRILSASGGAQVDKEKSNHRREEEIQIKVVADIVPDGPWPTSIESFRDFVLGIPDSLKKFNGGKGKPLKYVMIPLNTFRKLAKLSVAVEVVVRAIDESFLTSAIFFFEEIGQLKRKFHDLVMEMTEMGKYVAEEDLKAARKRQADLALKESELKMMISEDWVLVKSGSKKLQELILRLEKFKSRDLKLHSFEEYLDSSSKILRKLGSVKRYLSMGVVYLGRGDDFNSVLSENLSSEFLVLLVTSEAQKQESELYTSTCHYFLSQASDPQPNTKYVVVDFDFFGEKSFMRIEFTTVRCVHLKGSKILSSDAFADHIAELTGNFVRLKAGSKVEFVQHKPGNRVPLDMVCPDTCSPDPQVWSCFRCKSTIEFGFDEYFYCSCGRGRAAEFEYRCGHHQHGHVFTPGNADVVQKALSSLRPFKEMNILILGQSGVGKSTWINSIVNYLNFETMEEAKQHGVICTIPISFTMYDSKTMKKHTIHIGTDDNENTTIGQSATQSSHTYTFPWKGKSVRIIDTPGLCDTRGISQDKINLRNIVNHIAYLKELHAVCILLKANENKITAIFSYCLKELFSHLHKGIAKNIVFCFTNARNSFYSPGQASALLENLIQDLDCENLSLGHHNMFCLDNEAFLFLCSLSESEINHDPLLVTSFTQSWEISLRETQRLFNTINTFKPHVLKETLSLVTARSRIMNLSKPIAEISKTIQINVATIQRKKEEIKASNETLEELSKKLKFTEVFLQSVPLDNPRTVCTSSSCVEYLTFKSIDLKEIEYKTHCHPICQLNNVQAATVNNAALRYCDAMGANGQCNHCGCGWEKHMHITYSQVRTEQEVVDKTVQNDILEKKSERDKVESLVSSLEKKIEKYKQEQEFIIQASVKFGMFLRRNAISVYNDSVAEYLEYLIQEEECKPYKSDTEKQLLQGMKEMLAHYNAEVSILLEVIKKGECAEEEASLEEVMQLEQELYKLELTGDCIKKYSDCGRLSREKIAAYRETPLRIRKPQTAPKVEKSSFTQKLTDNNFMKNFKSYFF